MFEADITLTIKPVKGGYVLEHTQRGSDKVLMPDKRPTASHEEISIRARSLRAAIKKKHRKLRVDVLGDTPYYCEGELCLRAI